MADGVTFQLNGVDQITKALEQLTADQQIKLFAAANLRAARIPKQEILARAPRFTGIREKTHPGRTFGPLVKTIKASKLSRARNKTLVVSGIGSDGFYVRFLEFGTKDRFLRYRYKRKPYRELKTGVKYFRGKVDANKHAFVEKAIDGSVPRIISETSQVYGESIIRTLERWTKKQQSA